MSENVFQLIFAFDEIVALGYRESVNLAQIKTFTEMDSHDEKVYQAVRQVRYFVFVSVTPVSSSQTGTLFCICICYTCIKQSDRYVILYLYLLHLYQAVRQVRYFVFVSVTPVAVSSSQTGTLFYICICYTSALDSYFLQFYPCF